MQIVLSFLVVLGVGNLVATFFSYRLNKTRFLYEKKLKAYIEFLDALSNVIAHDGPEQKQRVVYHSQLLKLFAPQNISLTADEFFKADESGFLKIRDKLLIQMKNDLNRVR